MKKHFPHISAFIFTFILVFTVSGLLFPQTTYADYCLINGKLDPVISDPDVCDKAGGVWTEGTPTKAQEKESSWLNIVDFTMDVLLSPLGWLAIMILQLATLITWLGGTILNFIVDFTIVHMKDNLDKAKAVNDAWGVIRDVANMGFIFILLYAGIKTILGIGDDTKKLIVNIVIVAILINFSLFFTKVVIDASNVLSITFYDAIAPGQLTGTSEDLAMVGIAGKLMKPLYITSLWNNEAVGALEGKQLIIIGVMGTVVALIAAFIFFAIAIMFVIRFVILIFVLILSPLAFLGFILPALKSQKDQWVQALLGQAFFAPIYFMLTWIVIVIAQGLYSKPADVNMATVFVGSDGADGNSMTPPTVDDVGILLNFIIVIVFLIASLIIAKQWADKAGHGVPGLTKWAMGAAGGATLGMAGRLGRKTIGSWGANTANDEDLKARARAGDMGARLKLATANKMGESSFDIRGSAMGGTLGAGNAKKGGFIQDQKDRAKAFEKYKPSKDAIDEAKAREAETQKELDDAAESAIPKTNAHISAEERLKDLRRTSTSGFNKEEALAHKAKLDATREEIEQYNEDLTEKRKTYIRTADVLASTRARHDSNITARQNLESAMKDMADTSEKREPTIRLRAGIPFTKKKITFAIPGSGYIIGGKDRAAAIRAAAKGKSTKDQAAELVKKMQEEEGTSEAEKPKEKKPSNLSESTSPAKDTPTT